MSSDFDQFPLYDPLVKEGTNKMSSIWIDFMATFYMNLISYLTQGGIFLPQLTTKQRDDLRNDTGGKILTNGQMIYNTTSAAPQIYQGGVWKTFTTT